MFLHLPAAPSPKDLKVWIDIRQVVLPQPSDVPTFKQKRIVAATLLPDKAGWVEIHLKDITQEWFKDPSKNMGLEIIVNTENGVSIPVGIHHQEGERNVTFTMHDYVTIHSGNNEPFGPYDHVSVTVSPHLAAYMCSAMFLCATTLSHYSNEADR